VIAETTLGQARKQGIDRLRPTSPTPILDVECLLEAATELPRVRMRSHPETPLSAEAKWRYQTLLERRANGEPIAYCLGRRDFMDFTLKVSPDVLIPRPETEHLIAAALTSSPARVLDLGTGSGCVAIALARAWPTASVDAVDQSAKALTLARRNAKALGAERIRFYQGNWYAPVKDQRYDLIVANPPYIANAETEPNQGDAQFEPTHALRAGPSGLEAINQVISGAPTQLTNQGQLWLEHGYRQGQAVRTQLQAAGFTAITTQNDLAGHERISGGIWSAA